MVTFIFRDLLTAGPATHQVGITDLDVYRMGGQNILYSASGIDGGVSCFQLSGNSATFMDSAIYGAGTNHGVPGQLEMFTVGGVATLITTGRRETALGGFTTDAVGAITGTGQIITGLGFPSPIVSV